NTAFTLVAKVTIHAAPAEGSSPAPLLGAKLNDGSNTVLLGLSCTKDKKWEVTFNNKRLKLSEDEEWEEEKTCRVALGMDAGEGLVVYVGGSRVYDSEDDDDWESSVSKQLQELLKSRSISHFYFGGGGAGGVEVTVADVLLYSRTLSGTELAALTTNPDAADAAAAGPEEVVEAPDPGTAPQGREVEVAPAPPAGDSHLGPPKEHHQQEGEGEEKGEEEEVPPQLSQDAGKEAGEASTPSNNTRNSDAEEAEEAEEEKEKKAEEDEEEEATEDADGALASPALTAPAAASAPRTGATEQAVGAETSERQRGPRLPQTVQSRRPRWVTARRSRPLRRTRQRPLTACRLLRPRPSTRRQTLPPKKMAQTPKLRRKRTRTAATRRPATPPRQARLRRRI
ncbi:trans-sialidase, partial [Trypanosoma conorhini]